MKIVEDPLRPASIAGVKRSEPMTRDAANHGKPNPNFSKGGGYRINCQSCVVTYEARLRGYDVQTLPKTMGSTLDRLSRKTNLAWIDPNTKAHPEYIFSKDVKSSKGLFNYLKDVVKENNRYTIEFRWKGRGNSGHIVSLDRTEDGLLRIYDPQSADEYIGADVEKYARNFKYEMTTYGMKLPTPPKLLRVDDKHFNLEIVNDIMEGVVE